MDKPPLQETSLCTFTCIHECIEEVVGDILVLLVKKKMIEQEKLSMSKKSKQSSHVVGLYPIDI